MLACKTAKNTYSPLLECAGKVVWVNLLKTTDKIGEASKAIQSNDVQDQEEIQLAGSPDNFSSFDKMNELDSGLKFILN